MRAHPIEQSKAIDFMTGGNALFTIKSLKTGNHFTYKVTKPTNGVEGRLYVKLLTGSDNTRNYTYIGYLKNDLGFIQYVHQNAVKVSSQAPSVIQLDYAISLLQLGKPIETMEIWHEGRCCKCGRTLTVPESIAAGIGPECASKQFYFEMFSNKEAV